MSRVEFDLDILVGKLRTLSTQPDPAAEIQNALKQALQDTNQVQQRMPVFKDNDTILYEDEMISIWHCRFDPGYTVPAHDHQMTATIGIYQGAECNTLYRRGSDTEIMVVREIELQPGDVLQLQPGDIHTVRCASEVPCCGIHVYQGTLTAVDRSLFDIRTGEGMKFTDENYDRLTRKDSCAYLDHIADHASFLELRLQVICYRGQLI